jgi:hypothetical protein
MLPIAICRASPVSSGAQTTDKHNSDSAISFFLYIYLQITLGSINQIHDGKYSKLHTTVPLQYIVLNKI